MLLSPHSEEAQAEQPKMITSDYLRKPIGVNNCDINRCSSQLCPRSVIVPVAVDLEQSGC
jgi:hypothetical protein